ncbi:MAG TPA: T9SS type A sorting domain-containing protein, partial [Bacteroidales bacterium]
NQLSQPSGATEVCNDGENEYTTTGGDESDVITWSLSPAEAGSLVSNGMTATITWNYDYVGEAFVLAQAENDCGLGPESDELEILVFTTPAPVISGSNLVCINEEASYSTAENDGSSYNWEVIGGTIVTGQGSNEISVLWSNNPGQGFVIVNESVAAGCTGIDAFSVTKDDCTGIENNLAGNSIQLYPNPAQSTLNLEFTGIKGETYSIAIYNVNGQLLLSTEVDATGEKQTESIHVEKLPKGLYLLSLKSSKQIIWTKRFDKF